MSDWLDAVLDTQVDGVPLRVAHGVAPGAAQAARALGHAEMRRRAGDLVRMALCAEFRREPLRRDDLARGVLGRDGARAFPAVLAHAQLILRDTFGMELVDARARGAGAEHAAKRPRVEPRRAFVLRSALPAHVAAAITAPDGPLTWTPSDGGAQMGLLFLVLSVVLLSGRQCAGDRVRAALAGLGLARGCALPAALQPLGVDAGGGGGAAGAASAPSATQTRGRGDPLDLDAFLAQLHRQGYLESVRVPSGDAAPRLEWRWGPRADAEIGERAVGAFIERLYRPEKVEAGAAASAAGDAAALARRIERAAGSALG